MSGRSITEFTKPLPREYPHIRVGCVAQCNWRELLRYTYCAVIWANGLDITLTATSITQSTIKLPTMWSLKLSKYVAIVFLTLLCYHGVYVTPVPFDSRFFKLSRILASPFYVFFRTAFLTMSHTFASLFSLRVKWTP
jgi:hypothetical protein